MAQRQLISARRMQWLAQEIAQWRAAGIVDEAAAASIAARYHQSSQARAVRILLTLGAVLLGVGIIWLVASNLEIDEAGPLTRFAFVAALWIGFAVLAEVLRDRERLGLLAGPVALLAAIAYGGAIFQSAQSLQVPAYEPWLLAAWAAGALVYAYVTGHAGPLVLGVGTAAGCYIWLLTREIEGGASFVLGLAVVVPLTTTGAVLHDGTTRASFASAWRLAAALVALLALGAAAIPGVLENATVPGLTLAVAGAGLAVAAAVAVRTDRLGRIEVVVALAVTVAAIVLALVAPDFPADTFSGDRAPASQLAHTLAASALFLALGIGLAFLGVAREWAPLTNVAFAAIVLFVVVQSFGLIAPLFSGAALVLTVGAILIGCGLLADRGRRRLLREVAA